MADENAFEDGGRASHLRSEHDAAPWVRTKFADARSYDPTWRDKLRDGVARMLGIDLDKRLSPEMERALTGITGRANEPGVFEMIVPPVGTGGQIADASRAIKHGNAGKAVAHTVLAGVPYLPWAKAMQTFRSADLRQTYPNTAAAFDMEAAQMARDDWSRAFPPFDKVLGKRLSESELPRAEAHFRDKLNTNPIFDGAIIPPGQPVTLRKAEPFHGGKDYMPPMGRSDRVDYTRMAPMQSHMDDYRVKYGSPIEAPEIPSANAFTFDLEMEALKREREQIISGLSGGESDWLGKAVRDFDARYAANAAARRNQPVGARTIDGPWRSPGGAANAETIPDVVPAMDARRKFLQASGLAASAASAVDNENVRPWWWRD